MEFVVGTQQASDLDEQRGVGCDIVFFEILLDSRPLEACIEFAPTDVFGHPDLDLAVDEAVEVRVIARV